MSSTAILATVDATGNDKIMVGFNRRFAPLLVGDAGAGSDDRPSRQTPGTWSTQDGLRRTAGIGTANSKALDSWAKGAISSTQ